MYLSKSTKFGDIDIPFLSDCWAIISVVFSTAMERYLYQPKTAPACCFLSFFGWLMISVL